MSIRLVAWDHENARIEFVALKYLLFAPLLTFISPLHSSGPFLENPENVSGPKRPAYSVKLVF